MKNIKEIHNNIKKIDKYFVKILLDLYEIKEHRKLTNEEQLLLNMLIDLSDSVEDARNTLDDNLN